MAKIFDKIFCNKCKLGWRPRVANPLRCPLCKGNWRVPLDEKGRGRKNKNTGMEASE